MHPINNDVATDVIKCNTALEPQYGRICMLCGGEIRLYSPCDNRIICTDCCDTWREFKELFKNMKAAASHETTDITGQAQLDFAKLVECQGKLADE